jgi:hypothetical protein
LVPEVASELVETFDDLFLAVGQFPNVDEVPGERARREHAKMVSRVPDAFRRDVVAQ